MLDASAGGGRVNPVTLAFLLQTAASCVAIALMVAFAAWANIARPTAPLDEAAITGLLAFEFPGAPIDGVWISADRRGAIARSRDQALLVYRAGDGYVARSTAWSEVAKAAPKDGRLILRLPDVGAPRASFVLGEGAGWPPALEAAA